MEVVTNTDIDAYPLLSRGKVRDIYEIDKDSLLIITTDRMSAFDIVLPVPVPFKGVVLNQLTLFWMDKFKDIIPNHIIESDVEKFPEALKPWRNVLEGRSVIVKRAEALPVECIVRGYITGSGWESYKSNGKICDQVLPPNLVEAQKLENPIFTPTTKAMPGSHDESISLSQTAELLGEKTASQIREFSKSLYQAGSAYARQKGIIIADTKFEFGIIDGKVHLIDEVLTPDSSRFWPLDKYKPGQSQPSFDKQYLRDWLRNSGWNYKPPAPDIPEDIIRNTEGKYQEIYHKLSK